MSDPIQLGEFAVIYSLPGSYDFFLLTPKAGEDSFKVTDFLGTEFQMTGSVEKIELEEIGSVELHLKDAETETTFEQYSDSFIAAFGKLSSEELEKIILSRLKSIPFNTKEILNYLFYLKASNTKAFTYLLTSPETGTWIGATPERLVQFYDSKFQSMALAGTKPYVKNETPKWSAKEIHEHEIVANEIEEVLKSTASEYRRNPRENHKSGAVQHLKTEFSFATQNIHQFIKELHPSSAISGKPKVPALETIREIETHYRALYTGYLGFERENEVNYFVNLRCMQVHKESATLYLGGGITKESILEDEWAETEHKAQSLLLPLEKMQNFAGNDF
ncbi:MAG: chorismate-binding protein [Flavobacteriales bacterium]